MATTWAAVQTTLTAIYEAGENAFVAGSVTTPWGVVLSFTTWQNFLTAYDFAMRQQDGRTWAEVLDEMELLLKGNITRFFQQSVSTPDGYSTSYNSWDDFLRIYWFVKGKADAEAGNETALHTPIGLRPLMRRRR
jgi:hypothetical protein